MSRSVSASPGRTASGPNRLLVVVCTYNERENLPRLVTSLRHQLPGCHLLVVDDLSPDGTGAWATEEASRGPGLECLVRKGQRGLGSAAIAGLKWGLERGYGLLATLDADFSHDPADLARMVDALRTDQAGDAGVLIGSRYVAGGQITGWPRSRRWASLGMNLLSRWLLGLPVRDCTGALRVYRASALSAVDLDAIRSPGFGYLEELLFVLHRHGCRISELPVHFRDRRAGRSKASVREAISAIGNLVRLRFVGPHLIPRATRTSALPVVSSPQQKDR